jgi:hypothetical protein
MTHAPLNFRRLLLIILTLRISLLRFGYLYDLMSLRQKYYCGQKYYILIIVEKIKS